MARERKHASAEACKMRREIVQSVKDVAKGAIAKKDPDCPEYIVPPRCNFVAGCRLGVGNHAYHYHHQRERQHSLNEVDIQHSVLQGKDCNRIKWHAKSHLHLFIRYEGCVRVEYVPPSVSHAQLLVTIVEYCPPGGAPPKQSGARACLRRRQGHGTVPSRCVCCVPMVGRKGSDAGGPGKREW